MSSAVPAACRPGRFTIADVRALASLRALGLVPAAARAGFRVADWLPYLGACRELAAPQPGRKSIRMTTRRAVGWVICVNPASSKTCRAPTWTSPQVISLPGWVIMG